MNDWWDTYAYQQSNKTPPSATDCTRSVSVMIASTAAFWIDLLSLLLACPQRSKSVHQLRANTKVRPGLTSASV
jgi:hypothetical protein